MTPTPHERLAQAVEARRGELGLSLREVAERAGITGETLRAVRRGSNEPSQLTKRGIERALRWAPGSVDAILAGGDPTPAGPYAHIGDVRITTTRAPAPPADEDPKMKRATELLAEAQALLEEIRRERREGA
ncbi:MAG UNVERIFIED_CONTAM: helix-turn-helix transcriptional regulator [Thermobifida fusca]